MGCHKLRWSDLDRFGGFIFDLDGTLADSMHVWDNAASRWLLDRGIEPPPTLESDIAIMSVNEAAHYIHRLLHLSMTVEDIIEDWEAMAIAQYRETVTLKPGAAAFLARLHDAGKPLVMATSCIEAACESLLERNGIRHFFRDIIYSDRVGRGKAFPDVYLAAARAIDVAPKDCLVFEDLGATVKGVRGAGMSIVAVYDESCLDWENFTSQADFALLSWEKQSYHRSC